VFGVLVALATRFLCSRQKLFHEKRHQAISRRDRTECARDSASPSGNTSFCFTPGAAKPFQSVHRCGADGRFPPLGSVSCDPPGCQSPNAGSDSDNESRAAMMKSNLSERPKHQTASSESSKTGTSPSSSFVEVLALEIPDARESRCHWSFTSDILSGSSSGIRTIMTSTHRPCLARVAHELPGTPAS